MNYDVQIANTIRRGVSYAELVTFPIGPETFVRRANGEWIQAKECVELTHILVQRLSTPSRYTQPIFSADINECSQNDSIDEEIDDCYDDEITEEPQYTPRYTPQTPITPASPIQPYYQTSNVEEERIFIPDAEYFKCKQKRKAAIIGVCTLGLAGLSLMGVGNTWRSNIFAGTSFSANAGLGFVLKCLSFFLLTAIIAIPYFIYSVFTLIYYS
ncbi:MAG: hypothetical protein K2J66_09915, partial [Muribaculaceae bacterium]|nr:hypothetical protein [Muribaculaceae bacterium]